MIEAWILIPVFFAGFILALLFCLYFTCKHDYETRIHKVEKLYDGGIDGMRKSTYWIYTQTCKHCGKIKSKVVGLKD